MQKQILKGSIAAAATLSLLAACGPAPDQVTPPTASPSASATASAVPTASPSATASAEPTAEPTTAPTASAVPTTTPTTTPTVDPSASITPSALPSATDDISVVEKTTFNGKVYDDTEAPLDGVTIVANSLNSSVPYTATTTTAGGTYAFNNAPAGVQIEIVASRPGFTTRRRIEVLKSNKQGDPNANKYDFGKDSSTSGSGTLANALSDKPEVTMVNPGRNASGIDPATSFVLKFSEPMDRATVTDSFTIRAYTTEQLTVDNANTVVNTFSTIVNDKAGTQIWDKSAFNISWNSDDSEATLTFKEERKLPTDKDSDKVPDYQVTFSNLTNNSIKDKSGISRASDFFKLTDGNFENSYKFAIKTDEKKPTLDNVVAQTAENSGVNSDGDVLKVRFSERMIHYTLGPIIAGGKNGQKTEAAGANNGISATMAADNYFVTVARGTAGSTATLINNTSWGSLGGKAIFDTNDPTHKTVLLLPPVSNMAYTMIDPNNYANGGINDTLSVKFNFTDGTSYTKSVTNLQLANTYATASANLANQLGMSSGAITLSEITDATAGSPGDVDALDTYAFIINDAATAADGAAVQKTIASASIVSGANLDKIGLTTGMTFVTSKNGQANIYQPGDNVTVRASSTVLDPAGNSVDSSNDDASANAS